VSAYYNEFEPYAAQWLRNLIAKNLIAPGEVDERSITDVRADDLAGFTQCHFFAGIAGWSLAARLAGWPDDRELWTGSAPCQPYSVAGKGKGQDDDRDLWPDYFRLIEARRPVVAMGEQVAAAISKHWLDRLFTDMERIGYACESAVVPACAVNAPHRRDRVWFVADAAESDEWRRGIYRPAESGSANCQRTSGESKRSGAGGNGAAQWIIGHDGKARRVGTRICRVADGFSVGVAGLRAGSDAEEVEMIPLLAHGVKARVGKLRAFGNAIVPAVAAEVIGAYMDCRP
jgi:DNA (cytosine-5)-methyltransferase 1